MSDQVIVCPYCQKEIPLTEALSHRITEQARRQFEDASKKKDADIAKEREILAAEEAKLAAARESFAAKVAQEAKAEAEKLARKTEEKLREAAAVELNDLRETLGEKSRALKEAQTKELELRKQQRDLEAKKEAFELEMQRKLDEVKEVVRQEALKKADEDHRAKDLEKDKQINDMLRQIDELKRKAEQGSQQTQGEVLELELEDILKSAFPFDEIAPVAKGRAGADVLQRVCDKTGRNCGTIIWESKQTKIWQDKWIAKLKDDQAAEKAQIAVLLTAVLPKEVSGFGFSSGIWITNFASTIGLATALRHNLMEVAMSKLSVVGKNDKMEFLYEYLSGPEFRNRIQVLVEIFVTMQNELEQEKRAMARIWAKREKQIARIISNTSGMYGDVQGIVGASLPQIEALELEALEAGETGEEQEELL